MRTNNTKIITLIILSVTTIFLSCGDRKANNSSEEPREVFTIVEALPSYEGGMEAFYTYLQNEVRYPKEARDNQTEGKVEVQFVIERNGSVSNVEIINGIGDGCDEEAVRVVSGANGFSAGQQRGRTVRTRLLVPIIFELNKGTTNPDGSTQGIIIIEESAIQKDKMSLDTKYADGFWSGSILSAEGDPLPGANIVLSGTTSGTVSDLDGTFKLEAKEGDEVVISFVGYETIKLNNKD